MSSDEETREAVHEANNLLQAIAVEAKLVMDDVSRRDSQQQLLARIIDQTLEVSRVLARLQATGWAEAFRPAAVPALVEAALLVAAPRAQRSDVTLVVDLAPDLPPVTARPAQLTHVLVNLLVNAVQAVDARGRCGAEPRLVRLSAAALTEPARIRLTVWDNGVGVSEAVRRLLFTTRVTTKSDGDGLGVGLIVSKRIVEEHGGALALESRPGGFTQATVDLPASPPAEQVRPSLRHH